MKVSVVIPCYNVADFISECIQSVTTQSHADVEIICVDNNSKDNTLAVLQELEKEYEQVSVFSEQKAGAPAARNHGLKKSRGEWIQFLDADDLLRPDKLTTQIGQAAKQSTAPFVVGGYQRLDLSTEERSDVLPNERAWHGLITNRLGITSANLFKRSALMEVDGFDEDLKSSQEYDLMFRLMKQFGQPAYAMDVDSIIRSRSTGSISSADVGGNKHRYLQLTSRIADYLKSDKPSEYTALGEQWQQDMFIRIRLNAIDGFPDSTAFYRAILPKGFQPAAHPYTPSWFRLAMKVLGYGGAEKLRGVLGR